MENPVLIMDSFAGPGQTRPAVKPDPVQVGAGRGCSGLVGVGNVHNSGSVGSIGMSGVPILWKIRIGLWKIGDDMENKCSLWKIRPCLRKISALYGK